MHAPKRFEAGSLPALCTLCGIPLDAEYFDASGVAEAPPPGREVVLARFELPPQYCGVLMYFSQFTDRQAKDHSEIRTPGLEWRLLSNNRPLYPYLALDSIVNPWGYVGFPVAIRLDESSTLTFVVRGVQRAGAGGAGDITSVAGRIMGRYWYNTAYGDAQRHRF